MKKLILLLSFTLFMTACQAPPAPLETPAEVIIPPVETQPIQKTSSIQKPAQVMIEDQIVVHFPGLNEMVQSPLVISGEARGTWFFEGSFPVMLLDDKGDLLAQAPAESSELWMTEDFIPFKATLEFETRATKGELVLQKDNPSGLEELEGELRIGVRF